MCARAALAAPGASVSSLRIPRQRVTALGRQPWPVTVSAPFATGAPESRSALAALRCQCVAASSLSATLASHSVIASSCALGSKGEPCSAERDVRAVQRYGFCACLLCSARSLPGRVCLCTNCTASDMVCVRDTLLYAPSASTTPQSASYPPGTRSTVLPCH